MITALGMDFIGFDTPSIESYVCDGSVYRKLLSSNCIIIELIDLSDIEEGDYGMIALPQHLKGLGGSPPGLF
jgi:arylformamidase